MNFIRYVNLNHAGKLRSDFNYKFRENMLNIYLGKDVYVQEVNIML